MDLTQGQKDILAAQGHLLITGGPGSGKTTVAILRASAEVASLRPAQKVLFLSFARATVSRVVEAIGQETTLTAEKRKRIEVDTYHSFFWDIVRTHGYLLGLPRTLTLLTPSNEAIALSGIRSSFKTSGKLTPTERSRKLAAETAERLRLAKVEGKICFDLFAPYAAELLQRSKKIRQLISTAHPLVVLDEFQDTNAVQWAFVKSLGEGSKLIALADPEQRIFDFIGADPARIGQFRAEYKPTEFDLKNDNHRSNGTDIAKFGNDILTGKYPNAPYAGVKVLLYKPNEAQAFSALVSHVLEARKRLKGTPGWTLAILVPTKSLTRKVSEVLSSPPAGMPPIRHSATFDVAGTVLAAEIIAFLLEPGPSTQHFKKFVQLVCAYFLGRGGDAPTQKSMGEEKSIKAALVKAAQAQAKKKPLPANSILKALLTVYIETRKIKKTGDPDTDWLNVRKALAAGACSRLNEVAKEAMNMKLLDRGTQFRQALSLDWQAHGTYPNALEITRQSFIQEHFSTALKPETGVVVMNMHKAKGKQFNEVIIFEGWPRVADGAIVANVDRIVRANTKSGDLGQARQNLRVSVTRAKSQTTILTPKGDPCVLLT